MTLDSNLGFTKNPFSKKSSEQELEFLDKIFYEPNYYNTLLNDLSNGDSRFIIGQRGHGKSSIINKLQEDLDEKNNLTIKIDRFDDIPIKDNENALITLIIKSLT
jgi:putative ribosome biogenesis GTPase RsgA